jgi:hypothetical protein
MVQRIKAGSVGVNMHGTLDAAMPFGGYSSPAGAAKKGARCSIFIQRPRPS